MSMRPNLARDMETFSDERDLIEAAQQDLAAFAALFERHFYRVYAFVAARTANRSEAEDLTSEVFQKALENIASFEWRGAPFSAWLFRIAANLIYSRRAEPVSGDFEELAVSDEEIRQVEDRAAIAQLVNGLPSDQKKVVLGRFVDRKSIKEIADELNRSEGAIKQLQLRALEALRTKLEAAHG